MCLYVYTWLSKSYISDYLIYFLFLPCVHVNSKDSCFRPLFSFRLIRTDRTHQKGTDLEMYRGSVSPAQHASCMNRSLSLSLCHFLNKDHFRRTVLLMCHMNESALWVNSPVWGFFFLVAVFSTITESFIYLKVCFISSVCVWGECITGRSCRNVYSVCQCTFVEPCLFRLTVIEIHLIHW